MAYASYFLIVANIAASLRLGNDEIVLGRYSPRQIGHTIHPFISHIRAGATVFRIEISKGVPSALACLVAVFYIGAAATVFAQGVSGDQLMLPMGGASSIDRTSSSGGEVSSANTASANAASGGSQIKGATGDASVLAKGPQRPFAPPSVSNAPNEFQKFVRAATGTLLPLYGADFFEGSDAARPAQGTPVPNDYPLGPGDEVLIRGWGSVDIEVRAVVDRNGLVNIPKVGTVSLAGVRAADVEEVVRNAIGKYYRGFSLNVTLGQLRTITIYVVGQARRPGTYTVSSLSTLVTALSETGGPNSEGSLRHLQVKRAGKPIAELDFYAFLAKGEKSGDVKLIDGDVIVIPPAAGYVALTGEVKVPAIYEVRSQGDVVANVLELAGGLPVVADPRRALVERIDPALNIPRSVEEFVLDEAGLKKSLKSGDLITVLPIRPEFSNAVTLRGAFHGKLRLPYREGMTVTTLIPNKEALISRASLQRQNREYSQPGNMTGDIGNLYNEINWDYAVVERLNRQSLTVALIPFNLGRALDAPSSADDLKLQPGDTVTVFSLDDLRVPVAKRRVFVRIEGEVQKPGVYQLSPGESMVGILQKAGGLTNDAFLFGAEFYRESVRKSQQENLDKLVSRVEQQMLQQTRKTVANNIANDAASAQAQMALEAEMRNRFLQKLRDLKSSGRVALNLSPEDRSFSQIPDFRLENGDRLVVPSRPDFVQVFGSVNTESAMLWQPGKTISDYLNKSGVTTFADEDAVFVVRANGMVLSNSGRWLSSIKGQSALPGDVILMPEKVENMESAWNAFVRGTKDVSQIFANFGLAAAAIHSLNK